MFLKGSLLGAHASVHCWYWCSAYGVMLWVANIARPLGKRSLVARLIRSPVAIFAVLLVDSVRHIRTSVLAHLSAGIRALRSRKPCCELFSTFKRRWSTQSENCGEV